MCNLTHLTADELKVWNELDRAVGKLLKDRSRFTPELGNFDAKVAATLRDRIADPKWPQWDHEQYMKDARQALASDEWWNASSVVGGGA